MKVNDLNNLIEDSLFSEVKKRIIKESEESKHEVFHIKCEGEPLATFKTEKEAKEELPKYKKSHPDMELIIEKEVYESHEDMIDKLDEMCDKLEEENKAKEIIRFVKSKETYSNLIMEYIINGSKDDLLNSLKSTVDGEFVQAVLIKYGPNYEDKLLTDKTL
jgi:hypothetical protein